MEDWVLQMLKLLVWARKRLLVRSGVEDSSRIANVLGFLTPPGNSHDHERLLTRSVLGREMVRSGSCTEEGLAVARRYRPNTQALVILQGVVEMPERESLGLEVCCLREGP